MADKITGRNMVMYVDGNAVVRLKTVDINIDNPGIDIDDDISTTWGETAPGVMRFSGAVTANYDESQTEIWDACVAASLKPFYIYPTSASTTKYLYGNGLFTWSRTQPHNGTIGLSANIKGSGQLAKN